MHTCIFRGAGERNRGYAVLMTANKPETALYRALTSSLLLASHGEISHGTINHIHNILFSYIFTLTGCLCKQQSCSYTTPLLPIKRVLNRLNMFHEPNTLKLDERCTYVSGDNLGSIYMHSMGGCHYYCVSSIIIC